MKIFISRPWNIGTYDIIMHKATLKVNLHTVTDLSEHSLEAYEIRTKISSAGSIGLDKEKFSA